MNLLKRLKNLVFIKGTKNIQGSRGQGFKGSRNDIRISLGPLTPRTLLLNFIPLCLILFLLSAPFVHSQENENITSFTLKNGLNVVLIINRSSPMIASVVTVNAGSAYEDENINGVSHMLEHLLFNGTGKRTQEMLYKEQDMYGIYNNAHTSYDYTNYMVLVEKGLIEKGLDIQSDMLFNSIFPEGKIGKEKGIILNELARDTVDEHFHAERFFKSVLYKSTPYALPVLGTEASINNITREEIVKYYSTYYKPNNMTILVIGDFEPAYMTSLLKKYFGPIPPGKIPEFKRYTTLSEDREKPFLKDGTGDNIYMMIGFDAPSYNDKNFFEFDTFNRLINSNVEIDINSRLKAGDKVIDISFSFNSLKGVSSCTINVMLTKGANYLYVKKIILEYLKEFIEKDLDIKKLITSLYVEEAFLYEKPHYFGISKGQHITLGGWEFASGYIGKMEKVQIDGVKLAGFKYLVKGNPVTAVFGSGIESSGFKETPFLKNKEEIKYTDSSNKLTENWEGGVDKDSKPYELIKQQADSKKKGGEGISEVTLKNGLRVFINSNKDSNIFAVHILAKNRAYMEPAGKEGITDFLHRMMERRTLTRTRGELMDAINSIGGVLKTRDDPSIPYDDYYTSRDFSYIRFETIDKFYKEGLLNLSDILANTIFYSEDIEEVKKEMLTIINKEEGDPASRAYSQLYAEIFKGDSYSNSIYGTVQSISSISADDLSTFAKSYLSPENIIVTIGTSVDKALITDEIDKYFGIFKNAETHDKNVETYDRTSLQPINRTITAPSSKGEVKVDLKKSQGYIAMGILFDLKEDNTGYYVLSTLLSNILSANIREKMGSSYALGASFANINERYGLFKIGVGTKTETIEAVEQEIIKGMSALKGEKISEEELEKTVNSIISTRLMRSLSRISQSFILGVNMFYNREKDYEASLIKKMRALTPDNINSLANRIFKDEYIVKVIVK